MSRALSASTRIAHIYDEIEKVISNLVENAKNEITKFENIVLCLVRLSGWHPTDDLK